MPERGPTGERIVEAAYACMERDGLGATTVESIAREAEVGRATIYRYFPGGRDELVSATVTWAVRDFLVLPHLAFHQLDRVLDLTTALCRPHLGRFLADDQVRPAAEWVARIVLSYGFNPSPAVDPHDVDSVRRLVRTLPAARVPAPSSRAPC